MKNRLIPCVLACLMIFLVGCTSNTAKEAAQEITKTETSFPAGNTETNSQEDTAEEPESTAVQEETPITADESKSTAESQTVTTVQTKPAEEKTAATPATEKPKAEPPKQTTTQAEPEKQPEPVSYTHLDVYKRQHSERLIFVQNSKSKRAYLLQMRAFLWFLPCFSL